MKKNTVTLLFCLLLVVPCYSQFSIGLRGGVAIPLGTLRNEGATTLTEGIDFHYLIARKFSVGVSMSFVPFGAKESYSFYYYAKVKTQVAPLLATTRYYFLSGKIKPFVGVGLGAYYSHFSFEYRYHPINPDMFYDNVYYTENKFRFGVSPELGIAFEVLPKLDLGLNKQLHCIFGYKHGNSTTRLFSAVNLFVSYRFGK